jgi:hypothetical protein
MYQTGTPGSTGRRVYFLKDKGSNSKAGTEGSGAGPAWPTRTVPLPGSQSTTAPHRTPSSPREKAAEPSPPSARSAGHASRSPSTPARHLESTPNLPRVLSALPHQRPPRLPSSPLPRRVVDPSGPIGKRWLCLDCSCSIRFFCCERYSNACS